jgi:amidase
MGTDDIIYASAVTITQNIQTKIWSSAEVVEAHLSRIVHVNPQLNAVVELAADRARAEAQAADRALAAGAPLGPLHGVPMTIKDNLDTAGVVSTGGTLGRRSFVPAKDATVVARLRAAGAILLGKTNTPELTLSFETDNLIHGRTSNPYDLGCTSGGSSGGAAAIIAAGGSPFDIGSDTGGSIRLPAHFCGIAGLRPTSGRVPRTGHILPPAGPLDALTQLGPMARFVDDLGLLLPIISGTDWFDPAIVDMPLHHPGQVDLKRVRIAFHTDNGILAATSETSAVVEAAAQALVERGVAVEEERPAVLAQTADLWRGLFRSDGGATTKLLLEQYGTTEPHPWLRPDPADAAILCPVCAFPAIPHGTSDDSDKIDGFSYTKAYNLTGWPGAVVRCGTTATGLPIGVQIITRPWREDVALAIADYLEGVFGGWQAPTL